MHRALQMDDNLRNAFDKENFTWESGLHSLALTCRLFSELALDGLWYELDSLDKVLRVLPQDATMEGDFQDEFWAYYRAVDLTRPLLRKEWDRFDYYAKRIQVLSMGQYREAPHLLVNLKASLRTRSTPILFPRARAITISGYPSEFSTLLLSPRINEYAVTYTGEDWGNAWQRRLAAGVIDSGAVFTSLTLPSLSHRDNLYLYSTTSAPSLEAIQLWDAFDWETVELLATLPRLRNVNLGGHCGLPPGIISGPLSWFPSLREIHARSSILVHILPALKSYDTLENIYAIDGIQIDAQKVIDLVGALVPRIRLLNLMDITHDDTDYLPANWSTAPGLAISTLQHCSKLKDFRIQSSVPFATPSDEDYLTVAEAWPELEKISVVSMGWPTRTTLPVLAAFSRYCPKLRHLEIDTKLPEEMPKDLIFGPLVHTECFNPGKAWMRDTSFHWLYKQVGLG